jgi:hypothetical protein
MAENENRTDESSEIESLNQEVLDADKLTPEDLERVSGGGCTDFTATCERFSGSCTGFHDPKPPSES